MFTVLIDKENVQAFEPYIPEGLRFELTLPETIAIGAAKAKTNVAAGVLIARVTGNWLEILWLYVGKECRGKGAGSALIGRLKTCGIIEAGLTGIFTQYPINAAGALEDFLSKSGFTCKNDTQSVYSLTVADLAKNSFWKKEPSGAENVLPLEKVSDIVLRQFGVTLSLAEQGIALEFPVNWREYDQKLSMTYSAEGKLTGILLVEREDSGIALSYVYTGQTGKAMPAMLFQAGKTAVDTVPKETPISFAAINDISAQLTEKLFPHLAKSPARYAVYRFHSSEPKLEELNDTYEGVLL